VGWPGTARTRMPELLEMPRRGILAIMAQYSESWPTSFLPGFLEKLEAAELVWNPAGASCGFNNWGRYCESV
jgi:hypothetical protein